MLLHNFCVHYNDLMFKKELQFTFRTWGNKIAGFIPLIANNTPDLLISLQIKKS